MKSKEEILSMFYATLTELQSGTVEEKSMLYKYLTEKLGILYDILGDDIPEEYWKQIENFISKKTNQKQVEILLFGSIINVPFLDKNTIMSGDYRYIGTDYDVSNLDVYEENQTGSIVATIV